jgi:hypothetical protein
MKTIEATTGRKIEFVTNRRIRFGEAYYDTQSQGFDVTAGIVEINHEDKKKSAGVLHPEAQLVVDKEGETAMKSAGKRLEISRHSRLERNSRS